MQWRAMSYLDHDIILGADFKKNLWAVDTQTVEGEWRVHKGPWMPFYREGTNSEADILVECASLAIASAAEQACIKALLDRVLGRARRQRGRITGVRGLVRNNTGARGSNPRCR
ncbi:unnamed protein product [Trichogramma brassicae]|uniref:Uncharacterized protein n=1 Tax=Trichogramma brassicae TaxID=86971 RepID=A0A6H5IMS7_9HYME|nr:unnamed protein product [Trichogramma brassicae]